jgi:hypothetical protein
MMQMLASLISIRQKKSTLITRQRVRPLENEPRRKGS